MPHHPVAESPRNRPADSSTVLDAALTLMSDRGYHGTSLKQVADLVGIRAPSLYNHMDSKASLLRHWIFTTLDDIGRTLKEVDDSEDSPTERLTRMVKAYAYRHATHPREALIVNQETKHLNAEDLQRAQDMRRDHEHLMRGVIEAGNESGEFQTPTPMLSSFAIREMCVSIARWFRPDGALSAADIADQYATLALNMVRTPQ